MGSNYILSFSKTKPWVKKIKCRFVKLYISDFSEMLWLLIFAQNVAPSLLSAIRLDLQPELREHLKMILVNSVLFCATKK